MWIVSRYKGLSYPLRHTQTHSPSPQAPSLLRLSARLLRPTLCDDVPRSKVARQSQSGASA
ncbi:MAG: hypothetical protein UIM53_05700 [Acutalibacteraceae bacterium]|nr:hypothetical protein [Acutalibacteraceae bacterium]